MKWGELIVVGIKLLLSIFTFFRERGLLKAGEDAAIGKAALEIVRKSEIAKRIDQHVESMSDDDVLRSLRDSGDLRD